MIKDGDSLLKGPICKVCERKFQMSNFWFSRVPQIENGEESIKQAYKEHKAKIKEFEVIKKECVKK